MKQIRDGKETEFEVKEDRSLHYKGRACVPNNCELKKAYLMRHIMDLLLFIPVAQRCIKI